jgi:hypothetical protein
MKFCEGNCINLVYQEQGITTDGYAELLLLLSFFCFSEYPIIKEETSSRVPRYRILRDYDIQLDLTNTINANYCKGRMVTLVTELCQI